MVQLVCLRCVSVANDNPSGRWVYKYRATIAGRLRVRIPVCSGLFAVTSTSGRCTVVEIRTWVGKQKNSDWILIGDIGSQESGGKKVGGIHY